MDISWLPRETHCDIRMTQQGFLDSVRCPSSPHLTESCIISVLACLLKLLAKRFKIARERMVSIEGETVVPVGRARNVGRRGAWIGPNRLHRRRNGSRRTRKLECYKEKLDSFLQKVGYPLQEDSPLNAECVKESLDKVRLEAPDMTQCLWLCKNHYEWVKEREGKLGGWNVRVR